MGVSGSYWLVARVDVDEASKEEKTGIVSGDVQSTGPEGGAGYASFRSVDYLSPADLTEAISVEWTAADGQTSTGRISLEPLSANNPVAGGDVDVVRVKLEIDQEIGGLAAGADIAIDARFAGPALRDLAVRIAVEEGIEVDGPGKTGLAPFDDRLVDWWQRAGFALDPLRESRRIPKPPNAGWTESDIFAALQNAMTDSAPGRGDRADWNVCLLMLSTTDRTGLEGVMFDVEGRRQRQGAAIFIDAIRAREPDRADKVVLKTAVHELGHALNLMHRFDPEVRRSWSSSPMNYDWRYPAGIPDYWDAYGDGSFESDELAFLRHAPHSQVIPGGDPFGSAAYWKAGRLASGIVTNADEPWRNLQLWLTPPPAGTSFSYGQPIFVELSLLNTGPRPITLPQHILDLKAGLVDIMISKVGDGVRPTAPEPFTPIMQRCFSVAEAQQVTLAYGESLHTNANLAYGAAGSDFVDPGLYELTPVLTFHPESTDDYDQLVVGPTLPIRVDRPRSRSEERDGETLLGRDIGISLALGGSRSLQAAAGELADLRDRRAWQAAEGPPDPIAVTLARTAGIFEGRMGNLREAAELLSQATTPEAVRYFDPHTAEHTRRLAETYSAEETDRPNRADPAVVVVDMWTSQRGGPVSGGRGSGFLTTRASASDIEADGGTGWGVLAPASQLPEDAMSDDQTVAAVVTITSGNGVTQRVAAGRIDLVSEPQNGKPVLALLELSHPVPARADAPDVVRNAASVRPGSDLASFFGGADGYSLARRTGEELGPWSEAADQALAEAPRPRHPVSPTAATPFRYRGFGLNDVAGWVCRLIPRVCQDPPPRPGKDEPYALPLLVTPPDDYSPQQRGPRKSGASDSERQA